jgi:hypothetical protein
MATKMFYVTRDMKHPLYRGRMLKAGEPLELDGPTARLYRQLKAITDQKPRRAKAEPVEEVEPATLASGLAAVQEKAAAQTKTKRAPRKRTAKRTAKKNA